MGIKYDFIELRVNLKYKPFYLEEPKTISIQHAGRQLATTVWLQGEVYLLATSNF